MNNLLDKFRSTRITWDKATSRIYSPVTANASDANGRKLVVQIVNGGQVEDLTGAALHLYWETRDKAHDGLDVFEAVDLEKGEFELSYTTGMLSNHGVLNANLVLIDTVGRVVSERFKITVTEGIDDDAIQSENSFTTLTQALIDISNLEQNYTPRLNDLTAQLQQTAKKGDIGILDLNKNKIQFDETWMSDEFKQQMAGNTPIHATPADESITQEKMAFPVVKGKPSKNLYNKDTSLLNKGIGSTGIPFDQAGYFISDFIKVEPLTSYAINLTVQGLAVFFYDSSKIFQSTLSNAPVFETPANTNYVRFRSLTANVNITQLEKGVASTPYVAYGNFIDPNYIPDGSISGEKIFGNISLEKIEGAKVGKNKFNKSDVTPGQYILAAGSIRYDDNRSLSGYIPIKAGSYYTVSKMQHMAIFDENYAHVNGYSASDSPTFQSPNNAAYIRIGMLNADLDTFQLEEGQNKTDYEPFGYIVDALLIDDKNKKPKPFLRLRNAVEAWYAGEKFPVAFFGDSQTDGNGTTGFRGHNNVDVLDGDGTPGSVDYIAPNAYSKKLEEFIQEETDNPTARIYNAGYSGHSLNLMLGKREQLFSQAYSDTKMVGISMGTNDRNLEVDRTRLEKRFKRDLIEYVEWFYSKGIQPFILTSQASVEPDTLYESQKLNQLRNKKSEVTHAVINRIKKEVAKEYDLELIDVSKFGELFLTYSQMTGTMIINDKLHFNDAGHLAQAGYIFSKMVDRVVEIDGDEILSFTNQRMRSKVAHEHTTMLDTIEDGFKVIADYTKENTSDMLILDFWVLNKSKSTFTLKSYIKESQQTYAMLNGSTIPLTDSEQVLSDSLDIGLHHIQVFTGESDKVDFKGFKLIKNNI